MVEYTIYFANFKQARTGFVSYFAHNTESAKKMFRKDYSSDYQILTIIK